MSDINDVMAQAGYVSDPSHHQLLQGLADYFGMHRGGPFRVISAWSKGEMRAHVEQNTSEESDGSGIATIHPAVLVIDGPGYRAAVNPDHTEAALAALDDASKAGN